MDEKTPSHSYQWELAFSDIIKRMQMLHMYYHVEPNHIRMQESLASCEILRQNISRIETLIKEGSKHCGSTTYN